MFSGLKIAVVLIILSVAGGGFFYVKQLQSNLEIARLNNAKLSSASSQNNNFTHYIFFKSSIYRIEINWKRIPTIFCEKITYFEDVKENWQSYSQDTGEWIFLDDEKGKNK